jgi:hypothetical protein
MFGTAVAYVVAIIMLLFCGLSAFALIRTVNHFDPPEARDLPEQAQHKGAV